MQKLLYLRNLPTALRSAKSTIQIRAMHVKAIKMRWLTGGVNYSYLLSSQDKTKSWLIDPAEPLEVLPELNPEESKSIEAVVNTHHHYDHSGGNGAVVARLAQLKGSDIKVISGSHTSPGATDIPKHLQEYSLGDLKIRCIRTPCHTQDSLCYYVSDPQTGERCIFTGDTLFIAGCGRFFEGTGEEMDVALNRRILDGVGEPNWDTTKVYPGHEYTKSNVKFVRTVVYKNLGDNAALDKLDNFCKKNEVTAGVFTLHDELEYNPFMRLDDPSVRVAIGDSQGSLTRAQVMDRLRKMKNSM
ncbi:LANO_0H23112g1_1 [Lachancea nothofagi CBS 11611]|uniref:hydroxyacylglutathione hydrolase n=1 Tax=Lachancea nothofagi CBS 11611 TaxID=1266666 RepID=A0A1G4KNQ2_9SACH|nr:LANO_0H23112g1_1 [Lachancea nothofagi CBS 11611]